MALEEAEGGRITAKGTTMSLGPDFGIGLVIIRNVLNFLIYIKHITKHIYLFTVLGDRHTHRHVRNLPTTRH